MKLEYLLRGLPGHPAHPPLTDATIGIYVFATLAALADVVGLSEDAAAHGWWLALITGLIVGVPTVATGFLDWLRISPGTPLKRTATAHALANATATALFALAAAFGHGGYEQGDVTTGPFLLTLLGFAALTVGGWLGGAIVYVHGMRVLNLADEPSARAAAPVPSAEKKEAERG